MESRKKRGIAAPEVSRPDGRDELNLAEFPLTSLADRVPKDQKTLVFEDTIWDSGSGKPQTRRLTISASDRYGLPTALDDEVILGLVQLTRQRKFAERTVTFTRYELLDILGWRLEGKSYRRLDESLRRWLGVTLYYDKAWWDKSAKCWIDAAFHILDQITLSRGRGTGCERTKSTFTWNEVVFRSFEAGYLKQLDLSLYRSLKSSIAKRMFRFLDKRFYHRGTWDFGLAAFAFEHVGLSRGYDIGQLKRRLLPAIRELEGCGFLRSLGEERFRRVARGEWVVRFQRGRRRRENTTERPMPAPKNRKPVRQSLADTQTEQSHRAQLMRAARVDEFLASLSEDQRQSIEQAAVISAPTFLREGLDRARQSGSAELKREWERSVLESHISQILAQSVEKTVSPLRSPRKVR